MSDGIVGGLLIGLVLALVLMCAALVLCSVAYGRRSQRRFEEKLRRSWATPEEMGGRLLWEGILLKDQRERQARRKAGEAA